jgi:hypothetical protein
LSCPLFYKTLCVARCATSPSICLTRMSVVNVVFGCIPFEQSAREWWHVCSAECPHSHHHHHSRTCIIITLFVTVTVSSIKTRTTESLRTLDVVCNCTTLSACCIELSICCQQSYSSASQQSPHNLSTIITPDLSNQKANTSCQHC